MDELAIWTVFDHPLDYPEHFVARPTYVRHGGNVVGDLVLFGDTLDELRASLPAGLVRLDRDPQDDPVIVEVWM